MNIEQLQTEFVERVVQQADKNGSVWSTELPGLGKVVVIPAWIINSGYIGSALVKTAYQTAQDKIEIAVHYLEQTSTALKETGNHCVKLAQESLDQSGAYLSHGLKKMGNATYGASTDIKNKAEELIKLK